MHYCNKTEIQNDYIKGGVTMKKITLSLIVLLTLLFISACKEKENNTSTWTTKNPDAKEMLKLDKDADFFQWEGVIFLANVDWVDELKLTKRAEVGEITDNYSGENPDSFKNGMATKLPIGAKIYSVKEDGGFLIVEYDGNVKHYMKIVEG